MPAAFITSLTRTVSDPYARNCFAAALRIRLRLSSLCLAAYLMDHKMTIIILWLQVNFLMGSLCFGPPGFDLGLVRRAEAGPDHRCSALVAGTDKRRRSSLTPLRPRNGVAGSL